MPWQKTVRCRKAARVLPYATGEGRGQGKKHSRDNSVRILLLKHTPAILTPVICTDRTPVLTQKAEHSVSMRHN